MGAEQEAGTTLGRHPKESWERTPMEGMSAGVGWPHTGSRKTGQPTAAEETGRGGISRTRLQPGQGAGLGGAIHHGRTPDTEEWQGQGRGWPSAHQAGKDVQAASCVALQGSATQALGLPQQGDLGPH